MKQDPSASRATRWTAALPWVVGATVLASFLVLAFGSYFIYVTADPYTWLDFARNFTVKLGRSKFPFGYPLYLKGAMAVVGPYWVFLANLPVLLGLFALSGWMGSLCAEEDCSGTKGGRWAGVPRSWGFLAAWLLVVGANAQMLTLYLNPYRDSLSYVLVLASAILFVRSLKASRMWGVGGAGVLLGLACCVREPSVLMLLPMFAYGLLAWRSGRPELKLWRAIGAFALGMGLGVVPLLAQSYYATHQVLVPHYLLMNIPETQEESKLVPGMYFTGTRLADVAGTAFSYYWKTEKPILFLAAAGLVAAVVRRNRLVLSVVLPTAVGYAAFYSFYRKFFPRYFYVSLLFFSLLAGYGLLSVLRVLGTRIRPPRAGRAAGWLLLAAVACTTSLRLLGERAEERPHQVPQARAMAAAIGDMCPNPAFVYADRPLCEWISWFLRCKSEPLANHCANPDLPGGSRILRDKLARRLERGGNLYAAFWKKNEDAEPDVPYARRALDCIPVGSFDPKHYRAENYASGTVWLYRLATWTHRSTELEWPVPARGPHGGAYWFMVDAGDWPDGHASASITVEGSQGPLSGIPHGGTWVGGAEAEAGDAGRTVAATVESADTIPRTMRVRTGRIDEPLVLDFCPGIRFDHFWRWSGDILLPATSRGDPGVRIFGSADLELPVPRPDLAVAIVKLELRAGGLAPNATLPIEISEDGRRLARVDFSGKQTRQQVFIPLPFDPDHGSRRLHFEVEGQATPASDGKTDPAWIECNRAILYRWPVAFPVEIGVGEPDGAHVMLSGFSRPEGRRDSAFRWTTGNAEVAVFLPPSDRMLVLRVKGSVNGIPQAAREGFESALRVSWDDADLTGQLALDEEGGDFVWTGRLPEGAVDGRTPHRLGLATPLWKPSDFGMGDTRTLGVRISHIDISPAE